MTIDQLAESSGALPGRRDHAERLYHGAREPAWGRSYRLILSTCDLLAIGTAVLISMTLASTGDKALVGLIGVPYTIAAPTLGLIWLVALAAGGSRNPWITGAGVEEYRRLIKISLYVFGGVAIVSYILKAQFARSLFVLMLPIGILLLLLARWVARGWLNGTRAHGKHLTSCAVAGPEEQVARAVTDLRHHLDAGFAPLGVCLLDREERETPAEFVGVPVYSTEQLLSTIDSFDAVIATGGIPSDYMRTLAWNLEGAPTSLVVTPVCSTSSGRACITPTLPASHSYMSIFPSSRAGSTESSAPSTSCSRPWRSSCCPPSSSSPPSSSRRRITAR